MKSVFQEVWWWIKKVPCTTIILLASIITGVITKALWISAESSGLIDRVGYGVPAFRSGDFITVITGALVAPAPWMYALILVSLAIGGGYIEYKHGALRMLAALVATHVAAVFIVALLLLALEPTNLPWVNEFIGIRDVGLSNAGFGAMGAATAGLSVLWRRRVRTLLFLYCTAFLLFSGMIWDLSHFAALLVGFVIGPWVVERKIEKISFKFHQQEVRNLVACVLVFSVITRLVSKIYPGNGGLLAFHNPGDEFAATMLLTVGTSIVSLIVAYGLYAGRRVAWWLAIFFTVLSLVGAVWMPFNATTVFNVIIDLLLIVPLVVFFRDFAVKPDKIIKRKIYRTVAVAAVGLLVFNALAIFAIRSSFTPQPTLFEATSESLAQIAGVSTREFVPDTKTARVFIESIDNIWAIVVISSLAALAFTTYRDRDGRSQFEDFDTLLHEKGCSDIGWMARWPGMSYWVNAGKTAGFAYRLENNMAIVLGDPVGSRQAVGAAFHSFEAMCARRGWRPVYYAVSESFRRSVSKQKLKAIVVGEDTIIDLPALEFTGKSWQSVRSAVNRATKDGIRMRTVSFAEAPIGLQDQLRSIANGWVNDKSLPEMGFTLGTLKEAEDPEVRMHVAIDELGTVHGMTSWFPVYKNGSVVGWTIDIMQRRLGDKTMQGVIEFLIAESAMTFKQEGYQFISLSAAPLSHEGKAGNAIEALLDVVAKRMEPYYGFKSLYNFKKKFNPRHEPLYLCYRDEARLPAIAVAIGKAYMPEHTVRNLIAGYIKH